MNRRQRLATLLHERAGGLVHRADWLYVTLVLASGASWFLPRTLFTSILIAVLGVLVFVGFLIKRQHGARLCEQCVTEFAINAPEHAARHRRRFWAFHRSPWIVGAILPAICIAPFLHAPWNGIAYLPACLVQALGAPVSRFHSSYQPWCPYCRRGDDGGDGEAVTPEPTGGHGRPLPVL